MLEHLNPTPATPSRVVIMGAGGFVGCQAAARLEADGIPLLLLTRGEVDLLAQGAGEQLAGLLKPEDCLIVISAMAPCKNAAMLADNIADAFAPYRERAKQYIENPDEVRRVLDDGARKARAIASETLAETKQRMGLNWREALS